MEQHNLPPSWDGSVVLDIGGDVGALVLHTTASFDRAEIDLYPEDATLAHTHSAVRERHLESGPIYAAVYPGLQQGAYRLEGSGQRVVIEGGQVTECDYAEVECAAVAH